jgi:hypothetical protein
MSRSPGFRHFDENIETAAWKANGFGRAPIGRDIAWRERADALWANHLVNPTRARQVRRPSRIENKLHHAEASSSRSTSIFAMVSPHRITAQLELIKVLKIHP